MTDANKLAEQAKLIGQLSSLKNIQKDIAHGHYDKTLDPVRLGRFARIVRDYIKELENGYKH